MKPVFRQVGDVRLAATRAASASRTRCTRPSSCSKLWSYFIPVPPDARRRRRSRRSTATGYQVRPVVQAILQHPALYNGPRMVKPPVVHIAGLLRRIGAGITTTAWSWIGRSPGQQLFYPPNVAGWDDTRWLDTATFRGRWIAVQRILQDRSSIPRRPPKTRRRADRARRRRSPSGTTRR